MQPGFGKWTSTVVIKCLCQFFTTEKSWAKTQHSTIYTWFDPIPAFTIVMICTYIIIAIEEQMRGGTTTPSSSSKDSCETASISQNLLTNYRDFSPLLQDQKQLGRHERAKEEDRSSGIDN